MFFLTTRNGEIFKAIMFKAPFLRLLYGHIAFKHKTVIDGEGLMVRKGKNVMADGHRGRTYEHYV